MINLFSTGRKRNKGKARREAKDKAREEVEERGKTTRWQQQKLAELQRLGIGSAATAAQDGTITICLHGIEKVDNVCKEFVDAFKEAFYDAANHIGDSLVGCLIEAEDATMDEFSDVWYDPAKIELALSYFLSEGAQYVLDDNYDRAREDAVYARYIEQRIAVYLHKTQAIINTAKIIDLWPRFEAVDTKNIQCDVHTLVKFFRKRISCSCLDEKYEEVKPITKMGLCYNPQCKFLDGLLERSKTMYCSKCRCIAYCSRRCQKADWKRHSALCGYFAAVIAEFEARQES